MKAYEILMLMLIFNLVIWGFAEIGIATESFGAVSPLDNLFNWSFLGLMTLFGGAALAAYLRGSDKSLHSVVYGAFAIGFWGLYLKTTTIFRSIITSSGESLVVYFIFSAVVTMIFIVGFVQMATGGWKSYV